MNPDWDGVMKSRAREPGPLRQSLMAPSQWDAVQQLRAERDALAARVRELESRLAELRIGDLPSVNIRNGVAFSYCPECGTEQGPPAP